MPDVFVALLQINVALGCLYNGLETARYRTKLYAVLADAVSALKPNYPTMISYLDSNYIFTNNSKLAKDHHAVRRWIDELPDEYRIRIPQIEKWNFGDTSPEELPRKYRGYFGKNIDKVAVWVFSVLVPLSLMWSVLFDFYVTSLWSLVIVAIGQLLPAINVLFGRWMIRTVSRDVKNMLDDIVSEYKKARVPLVIRRADEALSNQKSEAGPVPAPVAGIDFDDL